MKLTPDWATVVLHAILARLLTLTVNDAYVRSHNMKRDHVTRLTIASVEMEPYLMPNPRYVNGTDPPEYSYIGYIADLVDRLSRVIGFEYVIRPVADKSFGHLRNDGTWDGIIGELVSGTADMAAAPMYATGQRSRVVNFSDPYMAVYATILLNSDPPSTASAINSLKDLVRQTEISYGTLNRGVLVRSFRSTNVTLYRMAWRQMTRHRTSVFTSTNEQGIERVRATRGPAAAGPGQRYAFIIPHPIGEWVAGQPPCDLKSVGRFLGHRGYALALPRHLPSHRRPLVDLPTINAAIQSLTSNGFLDGLYRKWWSARSHCPTGNGNVPAFVGDAVGSKRQATSGGIRNRAVIGDTDSDVIESNAGLRLRQSANRQVVRGGYWSEDDNSRVVDYSHSAMSSGGFVATQSAYLPLRVITLSLFSVLFLTNVLS